MDDFEYLDYDLTSDWYEPFDGAYTNNWTKISGTASVSGGKLNLTGSGNVVTKNTIGTNRYVKAEMNTLQNASNHWQVGWIQAKYEDWDNQIYGLLWPDGTVELAIRYNGNQNGWATSSGEISNPVGTAHTWEFTVSGDYVVLKIDGDIIFNEYHDNFGDIQGKVGLRADSTSVAEFDNIVIID